MHEHVCFFFFFFYMAYLQFSVLQVSILEDVVVVVFSFPHQDYRPLSIRNQIPVLMQTAGVRKSPPCANGNPSSKLKTFPPLYMLAHFGVFLQRLPTVLN